jgi:hypothetical protein
MARGALFVCAETFLTTFSFGLFFFLLLYTTAIERKSNIFNGFLLFGSSKAL